MKGTSAAFVQVKEALPAKEVMLALLWRLPFSMCLYLTRCLCQTDRCWLCQVPPSHVFCNAGRQACQGAATLQVSLPLEPWCMRDMLPSEILSKGVMPPLPAVVGPLLWVRESGTSTVTGLALNICITRCL